MDYTKNILLPCTTCAGLERVLNERTNESYKRNDINHTQMEINQNRNIAFLHISNIIPNKMRKIDDR